MWTYIDLTSRAEGEERRRVIMRLATPHRVAEPPALPRRRASSRVTLVGSVRARWQVFARSVPVR